MWSRRRNKKTKKNGTYNSKSSLEQKTKISEGGNRKYNELYYNLKEKYTKEFLKIKKSEKTLKGEENEKEKEKSKYYNEIIKLEDKNFRFEMQIMDLKANYEVFKKSYQNFQEKDDELCENIRFLKDILGVVTNRVDSMSNDNKKFRSNLNSKNKGILKMIKENSDEEIDKKKKKIFERRKDLMVNIPSITVDVNNNDSPDDKNAESVFLTDLDKSLDDITMMKKKKKMFSRKSVEEIQFENSFLHKK